MPTLADSVLMQQYAAALKDIYDSWGHVREETRRLRVNQALQAVNNLCGIPAVRIEWGDNGGYFDFTQWSIMLDESVLTLSPHSNPVRSWLYFATMPYHEMRHAEQFYLMAKGMLNGAVAIPTGSRGRNVLATHRVIDLTNLWYPRRIANQARWDRRHFSQSDIPKVRAWVDSVFGRGARGRTQTLNHLAHGGKHFTPYINLPEETDAWTIERQLSRLFRQMVNDQGHDEGLEAVAAMFQG